MGRKIESIATERQKSDKVCTQQLFKGQALTKGTALKCGEPWVGLLLLFSSIFRWSLNSFQFKLVIFKCHSVYYNHNNITSFVDFPWANWEDRVLL